MPGTYIRLTKQEAWIWKDPDRTLRSPLALVTVSNRTIRLAPTPPAWDRRLLASVLLEIRAGHRNAIVGMSRFRAKIPLWMFVPTRTHMDTAQEMPPAGIAKGVFLEGPSKEETHLARHTPRKSRCIVIFRENCWQQPIATCEAKGSSRNEIQDDLCRC